MQLKKRALNSFSNAFLKRDRLTNSPRSAGPSRDCSKIFPGTSDRFVRDENIRRAPQRAPLCVATSEKPTSRLVGADVELADQGSASDKSGFLPTLVGKFRLVEKEMSPRIIATSDRRSGEYEKHSDVGPSTFSS
jgi:hypothetical protein